MTASLSAARNQLRSQSLVHPVTEKQTDSFRNDVGVTGFMLKHACQKESRIMYRGKVTGDGY